MATGGALLQFKPALEADTSEPGGGTEASAGRITGQHGAVSLPVSTGRAPQIATLQHLGNGVVLAQPLYIRLEEHPDAWFAVSGDLSLIGEGESDLDAIDDLRSQIAELFESLVSMRGSLGPQPKMQLAFLEKLAGLS